MHKIFNYTAKLSCLLLALTQLTLASSVKLSIDRILKRYDPNLNIGIMVESLTNNKVIYQKNANRLFTPASTLKIFPAIAALTFWEPDYYFPTKILTTQAILKPPVLRDDIYFYFSGDPSLTQHNIADLIATIAQFGVKVIKGNIYIDDTIFDQEFFGPGWMWDERNFCYAAPTCAINLNKNCFPVKISTTQPQQPVVLDLGDYKKHLTIANEITVATTKNEDCLLNLYFIGDNTYRLTGCIMPDTTKNLAIAVRDVHLYIKNILREQLLAHNIQFVGEIKFKSIPTAQPLYTLALHKSEPLAKLLKTMLKDSDNLIADAIYKKLGHSFFQKPATWQNSAKAITHILTPKTYVSLKKMKMVDGSGLSRYNLVSAKQLVTILHYAYFAKKISPIFINALAIAGVDGTLKERMPNLKNRVLAKTGSMTSVATLAGYIKTTTQGTVAFAIMMNSFLNNPQKYNKLQDEICTLLANM